MTMAYTRIDHSMPDASTPFVGEIQMIGTNFAPNGWQLCNGALLSIAEFSTLFDLIGTTYGGDGLTTFAVPNLQGRIPIHQGTNSNGVSYILGQLGGNTTTTLNISQLPSHQHVLTGQVSLEAKGNNPGSSAAPSAGMVPAIAPAKTYYAPTALGAGQLMGPLNVSMNVGIAGASLPVSTMQPYMAVIFIISLFGVFPST
jgi:microcystin-dependent protein